MIYPKDIVSFIKKNKQLKHKFYDQIYNKEINVSTKYNVTTNDEFEIWMYKEGYLQSLEIKRYLFFLNTMSKIFENIYYFFNKNNIGREKEKDASAIATTPSEMMFIARYLYYLNSYGVKGDVLECGCFKGFSSCCLSHVCDYLGKKLIIADSFKGLPDIEETRNNSFYKANDYKGSFGEVRANISTSGKIRSVEFIKGWYSQSLVNYNRKICLLWIDVDPYQSTLDVLTNVYRSLSKNAVIFSHECSSSTITKGKIKENASDSVWQALFRFFTRRNIPYKAKYLIGNTGLIVPKADKNKTILISGKKQQLLENYISFENNLKLGISLGTKLNKTTQYSIDTINGRIMKIKDFKIKVDRKDEIIFKGWAIDSYNKELGTVIIALVDSKQYPACYGLDRQDVADSLKKSKYIHSGFSITIPAFTLKEGKHSIRLKIYSSDIRYYYLTEEIVFTIKYQNI